MQFQYSEMQQYYLLVNSKIAYVPPGRLTFLTKFSSNSLVCWQFRWSNASPASTSSPPATIQNYSNASNRLFKRRYPTNETQPKYGPTKCERSAHAECGKNWEILLLVKLTTPVKCVTGWATFWVKFPTVWSKTPVKCLGFAQWGQGSQ